MLQLDKLNEAFGYITTDTPEEMNTMYKACSYYVNGYRFMPSYKNGWFDGQVHLLSMSTKTFPIGLTKHIYETALANNYTVSISSELSDAFVEHVNENDVVQFINEHKFYSKGIEIFPRNDQIEAVLRAIKNKKCVNLCPTSFGKSLSITIECLWYINRGMRCCIIVPTKDLVDQFYNDIIDYSTDNKGKPLDWRPSMQRLYSGKDKFLYDNTDIFITTWQSLSKIDDQNFLNSFDVVITDECFDGDSMVLTPSGYKKIKDIQIGESVINYSEEDNVFKEDIVVDTYKNLNKSSEEKMYELEFDTGVIIKVTGNHKFLTDNGWKRADELTEDDNVKEYKLYE